MRYCAYQCNTCVIVPINAIHALFCLSMQYMRYCHYQCKYMRYCGCPGLEERAGGDREDGEDVAEAAHPGPRRQHAQ